MPTSMTSYGLTDVASSSSNASSMVYVDNDDDQTHEQERHESGSDVTSSGSDLNIF